MSVIRAAGAGDVRAIHALLVENAANDGGRIAGSEASLLRHGFGAVPRFRAVLAEGADGPLGLSLFFPEYSTWRGTVGVFIQDLYVRPAARGQGLGRALLAASVAAAADWDPDFVSLMVQHHNAAAQAFYAAQGFVLRAQADVQVLEGEGLARLSGATGPATRGPRHPA